MGRLFATGALISLGLVVPSVSASPSGGANCDSANFAGISDYLPHGWQIFISSFGGTVSNPIRGIPGRRRQIKATDLGPDRAEYLVTVDGIYRIERGDDLAVLLVSTPSSVKVGEDIAPDAVLRTVDIWNRVITYDISSGVVGSGGKLHYAPRDPNEGDNPRMSELASRMVGGAPEFFGIDSGAPGDVGRLVTLDPDSGEMHTVAENPAFNDLTNGFDIRADGCAYYSNGEVMYHIDLATAALTIRYTINERIVDFGVYPLL